MIIMVRCKDNTQTHEAFPIFLPYTEQINNKEILYSTGICIQYPLQFSDSLRPRGLLNHDHHQGPEFTQTHVHDAI